MGAIFSTLRQLCRFYSFSYTSIANSFLLSQMASTVILPYYFFKGKQLSKWHFYGVVMSTIGAIITTQDYTQQTLDPNWKEISWFDKLIYGDGVAFLSSVFMSVYILINQHLREVKFPFFTMTITKNFFVILYLSIFAFTITPDSVFL